jgi:hypothetical protein
MASTDFFIGYTATDQVWAEWIAETLERAGHSTVLQSWDFRPGENFVERMDETVVDAERVVAVLSPAYFRSEYARDEWTAALVRDRGEADRLLPVRVAPAELPPLLANRIYIDLVGVEEPLAAERLQPLGVGAKNVSRYAGSVIDVTAKYMAANPARRMAACRSATGTGSSDSFW